MDHASYREPSPPPEERDPLAELRAASDAQLAEYRARRPDRAHMARRLRTTLRLAPLVLVAIGVALVVFEETEGARGWMSLSALACFVVALACGLASLGIKIPSRAGPDGLGHVVGKHSPGGWR